MKTIITVVGRDSVGIIARVCAYLAENNINILDISQTIVGGYFNMMMVTDPEKCAKTAGMVAESAQIRIRKETGNGRDLCGNEHGCSAPAHGGSDGRGSWRRT